MISRITGQDGYYLSKLMLQKGYEVHGIMRQSGSFDTGRIDWLFLNDPDYRRMRLRLRYGS